MKILIISLSGAGNTLLATPLIHRIKKDISNVQIDLLVRNPIMGKLVHNPDYVSNMYYLIEDFGSSFITGIKYFIPILSTIYLLRSKKYDYSFIVAPANDKKIHLISYFINAKKKISHITSHNKWYGTLLNDLCIPYIDDMHDVNNNLQLGSILYGTQKKHPYFIKFVSNKEKTIAKIWLQKNNMSHQHFTAFSNGAAGQNWKKLTVAEAAHYIQERIPKKGIIILFSYNNEEKEFNVKLAKKLPNHRSVAAHKLPLPVVDYIIGRCTYFISNDSFLMHLAALNGIKQLAISKGTNFLHTAPYNSNAELIRI